MKTSTSLFIVHFLISVLAVASFSAPSWAQDDFAGRNDFTEVQMRVTHRIYPSFADTLSVAMLDTAQIGDTEFSFVVDQFLADFGIKPDGTLVSRSSTPHNPAFQVVVYEEEEEVDRHWAFFGTGKPHYRRDSLLAFEVLNFQIGDKNYIQAVPRKDSAK